MPIYIIKRSFVFTENKQIHIFSSHTFVGFRDYLREFNLPYRNTRLISVVNHHEWFMGAKFCYGICEILSLTETMNHVA